MEFSIIICITQRVIPRFALTMSGILQQQKRLVEENLLRFGLYNFVFFSAFPGITIIPVEARNFRQVNHVCILPPYTLLASGVNKVLQADQSMVRRP
jgi:hypothetical protein